MPNLDAELFPTPLKFPLVGSPDGVGGLGPTPPPPPKGVRGITFTLPTVSPPGVVIWPVFVSKVNWSATSSGRPTYLLFFCSAIS